MCVCGGGSLPNKHKLPPADGMSDAIKCQIATMIQTRVAFLWILPISPFSMRLPRHAICSPPEHPEDFVCCVVNSPRDQAGRKEGRSETRANRDMALLPFYPHVPFVSFHVAVILEIACRQKPCFYRTFSLLT